MSNTRKQLIAPDSSHLSENLPAVIEAARVARMKTPSTFSTSTTLLAAHLASEMDNATCVNKTSSVHSIRQTGCRKRLQKICLKLPPPIHAEPTKKPQNFSALAN